MYKDCVDCGRTFSTEGDQAGTDGRCIYCSDYDLDPIVLTMDNAIERLSELVK